MNLTHKISCFSFAMVLLALLAFAPVTVPPAMPTTEYLAKIKSPDVTIRQEVVKVAHTMGNDVVIPLGLLLADTSKSIAKSAENALRKIAAARSQPDAPRRQVDEFNQKLLALLEQAHSPMAKQRLLRFLSWSAGRAEVPHLARLLPDSSLFEAVRWTLERIPTPQADSVLLDYLNKAPAAHQAALLLTLGVKQYQPALPVLTRYSQNEKEDLRFAAYRALANIPDPQSATILLGVIEAEDGNEQQIALQSVIKLAALNSRQNRLAAAVRIYEHILSRPLPRHFEQAALVGLGKCGTAFNVQTIIVRLKSIAPSVRNAAIEALISLPDATVTPKLIQEYTAAADADVRTGLLRAISQRDPGKAKPLVLQAGTDSVQTVRATALSLFGEIDAFDQQQMLLAAVESRFENIRNSALHACTQIADKLRTEKPSEALQLYHLVLKRQARDFDLRQALHGITILADEKSLPFVKPMLYHRKFSQEAAGFYFQQAFNQAAKKEFQQAEAYLMTALGVSQNRDLANSVLLKMEKMGSDSSIRIAEKIGFVSRWWVAGVFPNKKNIGETTAYFPEKRIRFKDTKKFGELQAAWQKVELKTIFGIVPLAELYARKKWVAYCYTELDMPAAQSVIFKIGSNDGVICWVNRQKVHQYLNGRGLRIDQDVVPVSLKKGKNKILMKIPNHGGNWQLCLRVCDENGVPLNLQDFSVLPVKIR